MRFLLFFLSSVALFAANPQLGNVKTVYLLPMMNGFDQYIANQLQQSGLYAVTTDPKSADAVMTDSLGPALERQWGKLYPPPPPPADDKDKKDDKGSSTSGNLMKNEAEPTPISTFRRGRGNFFLVERSNRGVVWSTFERPKNMTPKELDKTARRIVDQLKKDVGAKP
ncbi:MAG: hypothetical protein JNK87_16305 [Bryobacterales bacterium]|nr:hypothetical protein [Bryobacterales bacterium]